jgi:hypothetical protein
MSGGDVAPWSQGALPILYILLQSLQWWFHCMRRQTCGRHAAVRRVCGGYRCAAVHEDAHWLGCGGLRSAHCREMWGRGCRGADSGSDYQEDTSVRRGRALHDGGLNACCLIIIGESFHKHLFVGAIPPSYEPS